MRTPSGPPRAGKTRHSAGAADDLFYPCPLFPAEDGGPQVVDAPGVAGAADRYMSAAFQFMNSQIHRVEVKPQKFRDSPLADSDGGSLVGIPCQQPVDATGGRREAAVAENGIGHAGVLFRRHVFGISVHFVFGFSEHVIDIS